MLQVDSLTMKFGGLTAVSNLSFQVQESQLVGLIGPNGAGKTTAFNVITGFYQASSGRVLFQNEEISGKAVHQIAQRGLVRTFQNIRLFKELSVIDNVLIGAHKRRTSHWIDALFKTQKLHEDENRLRKNAEHWLDIFGLSKNQQTPARNLAYGDQRKLEIIRCLVSEPKLLCLDEPAAGMNHTETHELMLLIARIRQEFGISILLIEHDMKLVMEICEKIIVLDHGEKIAEGSASEIQNSPQVIEAYLGTSVGGEIPL